MEDLQKVKYGVPLLVTHSRETKINAHTETCTWVFITVLFIIGQSGYDPDVYQLNKGNVVYPCHGTLFSHIREGSL